MTRVVSPSFKISVAAAGDYPTWRQGGTKDVLDTISGTDHMGGYRWKSPDDSGSTGIVNAWQGYCLDGTKWYTAAAAGHSNRKNAEWQNPVLMIDFADDAPNWSVIDEGSDYTDIVTPLRRYADANVSGPGGVDGRPASRHTYYSVQLVKGQFMSDQKDRIFLIGCTAAWAIASSGFVSSGGWPDWWPSEWANISFNGYGEAADVEGFRVVDVQWDAMAAWPPVPWHPPGVRPSIATDPRSGEIYHSANTTTARRNPLTGVWTLLKGQPGYHEAGMYNWDSATGPQGGPSLVDVIRDKLVGCVSDPSYHPAPCLQRMTIADPYTLDTVELSGDVVWPYQTAMVHDTGSVPDRYILWPLDNTDPTPLIQIDPDSGACTALSNAVVPACIGAPLGRMAYIDSLKVIVGLDQWVSPIWFMPTE